MLTPTLKLGGYELDALYELAPFAAVLAANGIETDELRPDRKSNGHHREPVGGFPASHASTDGHGSDRPHN